MIHDPLNSAPPASTNGRHPPARVQGTSRPVPTAPAQVQVSRFRGQDGVSELHLLVRPSEYADFPSQLAAVERAYLEALAAAEVDPGTALLRRFFCSDLANQAEALAARPFSSRDADHDPCAVSWLRMPPSGPAKVALWAYHVSDPGAPLRKARQGDTLVWERNGLAHHWTTGLTGSQWRTPHEQTHAALVAYDEALRMHRMSWPANVLRTWLFVQDIGANYSGVVQARREFFRDHGLTPATHFIASTGIEGAGSDPGALVTLDAYAVRGLREGQVRFLSAPDHLCPTHVYGVTFERGVAISYRDRRHLVISGTASIDAQGRIVHAGDVGRQLDRTLENVAALLGTAGATLSDLGVLIAYVRDPADQAFVRRQLRARLGRVPLEVFIAPVCRPGWLVEVEGIAAIPASEPALPAY